MNEDDAIYPTGTCFTDAVELLEAWAVEFPDLLARTTLVHAIVQPAGKPRYSHAWLEVRTPQGREGWQSGIWRGVRITYAVAAAELEGELRVERKWEYTPEQVLEENRRSGHYGPWVPELLALCRDHVCRNVDVDETQQELAR